MFKALSRSPTFERIQAAESFTLPQPRDLVPFKIGTVDSNDAQKLARYVTRKFGCLVCNLELGGGKTYIAADLLSRGQRPILLGPGAHRMKIYRDFADAYLDKPDFISYEELTLKNRSDILYAKQPDIIVADEAHFLTKTHTATKRIIRYIQDAAHEGRAVSLFPLSASLLPSNDLFKYAHLFQLALFGDSPFPQNARELEHWKECFDMNEPFTSPDAFDTDKVKATEMFKARIASWPGVMHIPNTDGVEVALNIQTLDVRIYVPESIDYTHKLNCELVMPDGRELLSGAELWDAKRQLDMGGYYHWLETPPEHWREARRNFHRFVRKMCMFQRFDTEAQVTFAYPEAYEVEAWMAVRDEFKPNSEWVQINDHMTDYVQELVARAPNTPTLVWVKHQGFGRLLAGRLGVEFYNSGGKKFLAERNTCVVSQDAMSEGFNLQHYCRNIFVQPDSNPVAWHQRLGRTYRKGQRNDVECIVCLPSYDYQASFQEARDAASSDKANLLTRATYIQSY